MINRRVMLKGLAGTALTPLFPDLVMADTGLSFSYGWDRHVEAPRNADFYVSLDGDDDAPGTFDAPFRHLQRGVDMLARRGQGSLAIRGGVYREQVALDELRGRADAPFRIHRFGSEEVTISAADPLVGWQPVTISEAQDLGATAAGLFKATVSLASLAHGSAQALNVHENGIWVPQSSLRAVQDDPTAYNQSATFFAGRFLVDDEDHILAIQDDRFIGMSEQLFEQVQVLLHHRPNLVSNQPIARFESTTGTIFLADQSKLLQRRGGNPVPLYALQNVSWTDQIGVHFVRTNASGQVTVYLRPKNPAGIERSVEISPRTHCLDLGGAAYLELFGLNTIRAAGITRLDGLCIRRSQLRDRVSGLRLEHCRAGENYSGTNRGYGAIFLRNTQDLMVHSVTIEQCHNSFGISVFDGVGTDIRYLHAADVSQSPARFYTLRDSVFAFSLLERSATDNHANQFNFYEGSDNVLVYGVRTRQIHGYATFQESSRIHFAFCEIQGDADSSGRALASQNRRPGGTDQGGADGSGEPVAGGTFYFWNNSLLVDPDDPTKANSLSIGPGGTSQRFAVHNNILHGGGFTDVYHKGFDSNGTIRSHNRYTGLSFWQSSRYGWQLSQAEAEIGFGQIPQTLGLDMRDIISRQLAGNFPQFTHWALDIDGRPVDWSSAPIGCKVRQ